MRPPESFIAQPVRSLQTMLRVIAESDRSLPSVIPDGIYGQNTVASVSAFQRRSGIPVTGVTDNVTWDAIVLAYDDAFIQVGETQPIEAVFNPNQIIRSGEAHPNVYLAQAMLIVLSEIFESITRPGISGVLDIPTSQSLRAFQILNRLPETGELDRKTWRHLALQYPLAANLTTRQEK